jgi:hypothetical protein
MINAWKGKRRGWKDKEKTSHLAQCQSIAIQIQVPDSCATLQHPSHLTRPHLSSELVIGLPPDEAVGPDQPRRG